jgi:hypothetical protein
VEASGPVNSNLPCLFMFTSSIRLNRKKYWHFLNLHAAFVYIYLIRTKLNRCFYVTVISWLLDKRFTMFREFFCTVTQYFDYLMFHQLHIICIGCKVCSKSSQNKRVEQQRIGHVRCCLVDPAAWLLVTQATLFQIDQTLHSLFRTGIVTGCVVVLSHSLWSW